MFILNIPGKKILFRKNVVLKSLSPPFNSFSGNLMAACILLLSTFLLPGAASGQLTDSQFLEDALSSAFQESFLSSPPIHQVYLRPEKGIHSASIFEDCLARFLTSRDCGVIRSGKTVPESTYHTLVYSSEYLRITVFPGKEKDTFRRCISSTYSLSMISQPGERVLWVCFDTLEKEDDLLSNELERSDDLAGKYPDCERFLLMKNSHTRETILTVILLAVLSAMAL